MTDPDEYQHSICDYVMVLLEPTNTHMYVAYYLELVLICRAMWIDS